MKIFIVENHVIEMWKEEIRLVPEFRELLIRDKGLSGTDINSKSRCYKEFKYIYFICDYQSPYVNYPDKERDKYAKKDAGLDDDFVIDNAIKRAIDKYRFLQETPSIKILNSLNRGLMLSSNVIDNVCNNIQYLLDEIEANLFSLQGSEEKDPIKLKEMKKALVLQQMEYTAALVNNLSTLQDLGTKIPKTLISIEDLAKKVKKESEGDDTIRGGGKKGNRADPR